MRMNLVCAGDPNLHAALQASKCEGMLGDREIIIEAPRRAYDYIKPRAHILAPALTSAEYIGWKLTVYGPKESDKPIRLELGKKKA